jgi:hypothetical protein
MGFVEVAGPGADRPDGSTHQPGEQQPQPREEPEQRATEPNG